MRLPMNIIARVKKYKTKLERKFSTEPRRQQFNFVCTPDLIKGVRGLAKTLQVPVYVLTEHLLQLGAQEAAFIIRDEALRERLCRHLLEDHLLVPAVKPESEPVSRRVSQLENAMLLLKLLDTRLTSNEQRELLLRLLREGYSGSDGNQGIVTSPVNLEGG